MCVFECVPGLSTPVWMTSSRVNPLGVCLLLSRSYTAGVRTLAMWLLCLLRSGYSCSEVYFIFSSLCEFPKGMADLCGGGWMEGETATKRPWSASADCHGFLNVNQCQMFKQVQKLALNTFTAKCINILLWNMQKIYQLCVLKSDNFTHIYLLSNLWTTTTTRGWHKDPYFSVRGAP